MPLCTSIEGVDLSICMRRRGPRVQAAYPPSLPLLGNPRYLLLHVGLKFMEVVGSVNAEVGNSSCLPRWS